MPNPHAKMKVLWKLAESSWTTETKLYPLCDIHTKTMASLKYLVSYIDKIHIDKKRKLIRCNLEVVFESPGYMLNLWYCSFFFNSKFNLAVTYPKSFDPRFSPHFFALTPKIPVVATKTFINKNFYIQSMSILWGLKFLFLLLLRKTLSACFYLEDLAKSLFFFFVWG